MKKDSLHNQCMRLCVEMLHETTGSETKASGGRRSVFLQNRVPGKSFFHRLV